MVAYAAESQPAKPTLKANAAGGCVHVAVLDNQESPKIK